MNRTVPQGLPAALALGLVAQVLLTTGLAAEAPHAARSERWRAPLLHRGGVDTQPCIGRFSLALGAGAAGTNGIDDARPLLAITPRIALGRRARARLTVALPLLLVSSADSTPRDLRFEGDLPLPIDKTALETGATIIFAPSLEWTFRPGCCLEPSVFIGAGIRHDRGASERVLAGDVAPPIDVTIDDATSPLLTFGVALERALTRRSALRFEARGLTSFYGETEIRDASGSPVAELGGGTVSSAMVTISARFGL